MEMSPAQPLFYIFEVEKVPNLKSSWRSGQLTLSQGRFSGFELVVF
jgi:hypothetical protein